MQQVISLAFPLKRASRNQIRLFLRRAMCPLRAQRQGVRDRGDGSCAGPCRAPKWATGRGVLSPCRSAACRAPPPSPGSSRHAQHRLTHAAQRATGAAFVRVRRCAAHARGERGTGQRGAMAGHWAPALRPREVYAPCTGTVRHRLGPVAALASFGTATHSRAHGSLATSLAPHYTALVSFTSPYRVGRVIWWTKARNNSHLY